MSIRYLCLAIAASLFWTLPAPAQLPAAGGAAGGPAAAPGGAAAPAAGAAAGGAAPKNIWSFLCMTPEQKAACKAKLCASPLVKFMGGALTPARAFSGGLLPQCCPNANDANPNDLLKPADSAEGAAARIKQKEAQAKARRAAIRYLGTVDCRRYPEAEAALINGLRADENECVRFEAALALGNGCCCTKQIIEALTLTVSGRKSNDPAETSERVKCAAAVALARCLARYCETGDAPKQPEKPGEPGKIEEPPPDSPPQAPTPEPGQELPAPIPADKETPGLLPAPRPTGSVAPPHIEDARRVLHWHRMRRLQRTASTQGAKVRLITTPEPPLVPEQRATAIDIPVQKVTPVLAQVTAQTPPPQPVSSPVPSGAEESVPLPPATGRRDIWSVLKNAIRGP